MIHFSFLIACLLFICFLCHTLLYSHVIPFISYYPLCLFLVYQIQENLFIPACEIAQLDNMNCYFLIHHFWFALYVCTCFTFSLLGSDLGKIFAYYSLLYW